MLQLGSAKKHNRMPSVFAAAADGGIFGFIILLLMCIRDRDLKWATGRETGGWMKDSSRNKHQEPCDVFRKLVTIHGCQGVE
ncbi:unnamed protein product [Gongylonema pulchrum]|uniref:Secreted protein n=1 Tax=Gongylonema pulchrum TaxID=637853 RepID=A0A183DQZ6_9BILA|nr:unnamed protein product [Gongylonema pulchrum]